jgi:DNA-binding response OmpR family regulator
MPSGLVLVIDDDEWVSGLLASAIHGAGYDVSVCSSARAGLETAISLQPDCIICDSELQDHDGYWVASNVRTHPSRVSVTPFLFLSTNDDQAARLEGFHVGADVYMTKPFRVDEVVAQVGALVQMAARLRVRRDSMIAPPDSHQAGGTAIEGDLSQMSIATVLTILEMERRSGTFEVISKKRRAQLELANGGVTDGTVGGTKVSALAAMRAMIGCTVGRFSFTPSGPREAPQSQKSIGAFLFEAVRLQDESMRAELELPPSRRPGNVRDLSPPSLGGLSSFDDVAPVSSRSPHRLATPVESLRPVSVMPMSEPPDSIDVELEAITFEPDPPSLRAPALQAEPARTGIRMPKAPPPPPPRAAPIPPPRPRRNSAPPKGGATTAATGPAIPPAPIAPRKMPSRPPRPEPKKR